MPSVRRGPCLGQGLKRMLGMIRMTGIRAQPHWFLSPTANTDNRREGGARREQQRFLFFCVAVRVFYVFCVRS